jgi:prepilin-type N-terminal cleavage/methylation domain-containing protein
MPTRCRSRSAGFSLVELAVVLTIVALLVGGLLMPLSAQYDARGAADTRRQLQEAREALIGFALAKGHLPCPADAASNGEEAGGRSGGLCNKRVGLLPWAALGTARLDGWGHQFHYSVAKVFTDNSTAPAPSFGLGHNGDIAVKGEGGAALTSSGTVTAVVLSHGRNGIFGVSDAGTAIANPSATNLNEQENGNATGAVFHDRMPTADTGAAGGEIDDMLVWLPTYLLMNRLVAARKLP